MIVRERERVRPDVWGIVYFTVYRPRVRQARIRRGAGKKKKKLADEDVKDGKKEIPAMEKETE